MTELNDTIKLKFLVRGKNESLRFIYVLKHV